MLSRHLDDIKASAVIGTYKNELKNVADILQRIPLWRPGAALSAQCDAAVDMIGRLGDRLDRKLVVSLIGPCGSGKSTLINALAGKDGLSETGIRRPTTRNVRAVVRRATDAAMFREQVNAGQMTVITAPEAPVLDHMVLVDTPDTDSTQQAAHIPLIEEIIGLSDILVCVFDGENPKRKDHVDFMAPYVKRFHGMSLIAVVNKCDRQSETELKEQIMPAFSGFLSDSWDQQVNNLFCVSARSHLEHPDWDPGTEPRHGFDQYDDLYGLIHDTFGKSGFNTTQRLRNAGQIRNHVMKEVGATVQAVKNELADSAGLMRQSEAGAMKSAVSALKSDPVRQHLGINVQLYQKLTQRWVGPVGWLIAIWARILVFGSGFAAMFRLGNPLRMLFGAFSAVKHYKSSTAAVKAVKEGRQTTSAMVQYRMAVMQDWPDIAEKLVGAGFSESIRHADAVLVANDGLSDDILDLWTDTLEQCLDTNADRLSNFALQIVFNLPPVGMLAYVGWLTTTRFLSGNILSSDFFLHAFLTIGIVLFLTFFIFQGIARILANGTKVYRQTFESLQNRVRTYRTISRSPVGEQIEQLLQLTD